MGKLFPCPPPQSHGHNSILWASLPEIKIDDDDDNDDDNSVKSCAPGHHAAKRRRNCTRQPPSGL